MYTIPPASPEAMRVPSGDYVSVKTAAKGSLNVEKEEQVNPLLEEAFPALPYAAALIGPGSEVLGFDTFGSKCTIDSEAYGA